MPGRSDPVPIAASAPPAGVIKMGWMSKLGEKGQKRCWVVIRKGGVDGPELSWADTENGAPRRSVLLLSALISVPKPAPVASSIVLEPNTVLIRPARGPHTKPVYLACATRAELIPWLDQLLAAAHKDSP